MVTPKFQLNGLVANLCLYRVDDTTRASFIEVDKISGLFDEAKALASAAFSIYSKDFEATFDLDCLVHSLSELSAIFDACSVQQQGHSSAMTLEVPKPLEMRLTTAEESWMQSVFDQVEVQLRSVVPSGKFFGEVFNLLSREVPVGPDFSIEWLGIVTERAKRVLQSVPEFQGLSEKHQVLALVSVYPWPVVQELRHCTYN